jgi:hypothetical protein
MQHASAQARARGDCQAKVCRAFKRRDAHGSRITGVAQSTCALCRHPSQAPAIYITDGAALTGAIRRGPGYNGAYVK